MLNISPRIPTISALSIILHAIQVFVAISVLGLAGFILQDRENYGAVWSIVSVILTLVACFYIISSSTFLPYLHHSSVVGGLHFALIIIWMFQVALVSYEAYRQSLTVDGMDQYQLPRVSGAILGALELVLWIASLTFLTIRWVKSQKNSTTNQPDQSYRYSSQLEQKIPTASLSQAPQQPFSSASTPPSQYHQSSQGPYTPNQQLGYNQQQQQPGYNQQPYQPIQPNQPFHVNPQDPVVRTNTVSPLSTGPLQQHPTVMSVSTMSAPKTSGAYTYDPDLPELSTPQVSLGFHRNASELSVPKYK